MDPQVKVAVEKFQGRVKAVLGAEDAAQLAEAERSAVDTVGEHDFLRWAPLPIPKP